MFLTLIVALKAPGATTAMFGWLALKMASNWLNPSLNDQYQIKNWRMSALLAGIISMAFAYVGGRSSTATFHRLHVGGISALTSKLETTPTGGFTAYASRTFVGEWRRLSLELPISSGKRWH